MERKPTVAEISPDKSSSPIEFTGSSVKPLSTQIKENSFFQSINGSSEKQLPNENEVPDQQFKDESRSPVGAEEVQVGIFPESEVIKKASDLSCENKMLQGHIKNLQEHVSAVEEQLEQKQGQCEMVNSQLKDKEQRLKEALEYISALKEVMRIEDGRHSSALKKACSDHDSVKKELESCTNECIGYLNQLLEAQADGKAIEKDKLELERNVNVTIGALQAEIQQLKLHLETSSAELSAAGEKALQFQEKNEVLRSQLDSLQHLNDSEENLRLDLTKIQQELDSERAVDTATEILAEEKLSGTKNALEFQVNELQENLEVVQHQNQSIKQELYSERSAHSETKSPLELCQNQLEEGRNRHLLELSKVQNTVNILKDEKNALQSQVDEFQANLFAASSSNESLKKELEAIREKNLAFERQLEFSAIEMSTLRVEAQKQSNRNNELQVHLDDMEDLLLSDRTKLRAEIANLLKEKLEMEETAQRLERTARAQEPNIEIVTENNLKLMKDKLEIEETVKRLEKTLSAYEEYIKITHQTVCCTLVFTENLKAVNNASSLINEIKSFMEKIGSIRQNAEVVDEDFKDLNFSFTETKNSFLVNKDTDKRDSKTVAMDEDGIKIIEEPPPSATRKAPTRSAAVAEKRSLSVQKENEHSSRTSSNEPTDINNEAYAIRGRQKLVPSPPCNFPMPMLMLEDCLRVRQNPKTARARKDESQISDDDSYSFTATPFLSAKQNDAPEYLSMNARTCQTNPNPVIPLSVPPAKKCRNK